MKNPLPPGVSHNAICGFVDIMGFFFLVAFPTREKAEVLQKGGC